MTKNQKIAAGCGAVGCLGLIVVSIVVGAVLYFRSQRTSYADRRGRTFNVNINVNSNQNSNVSENENSNDSSSSSTSTTFSDDDKHKLFQAASMSQDADLLQKVVKKLGLFKADGTPSNEYPEFIKDHIVWGASNTDFISSLNTTEKARAYVDSHLGE